MKILTVKSLTKTFQETIACQDISFSMDKGETLAIIGPSGSGKSTLLRMIVDLETPDSGEINLFETPCFPYKKHEKSDVYQKVGYIFQDYNLFDHLNVEDNLKIAMKVVQKKSTEFQETKVCNLLSMLDLQDKAKSYSSELSGGQKQ
ncbi:MAG: ATP-binding cassette domain-containing protein, partial [Bacilli bacterium]